MYTKDRVKEDGSIEFVNKAKKEIISIDLETKEELANFFCNSWFRVSSSIYRNSTWIGRSQSERWDEHKKEIFSKIRNGEFYVKDCGYNNYSDRSILKLRLAVLVNEKMFKFVSYWDGGEISNFTLTRVISIN